MHVGPSGFSGGCPGGMLLTFPVGIEEEEEEEEEEEAEGRSAPAPLPAAQTAHDGRIECR